jgi:hypothetical protein
MTLMIGITTADRSPRKNYIADTLHQLWQQGVPPSQVHVFASAPDVAWLHREVETRLMLTVSDLCTLHVPKKRLTRNENGLALLQGLPPSVWALHLEDDLLFCADFVGSVTRWLRDHAEPVRKVYTFCTFKVPTDHALPYWDQPRDSYGCQAVAMRHADLRHFGRTVKAELPNWRRSMSKGWRESGFDMLMRKWARQPFRASHPSFVQHVGDETLAHAFRNRKVMRAKNFAGTTWTYNA